MMGITSLHISTLAATVLFIIYVSVTLLSPRSRKFILKNILALMAGTYLAGFLLYLYGFWFGASDNFFTSSLRAAISALEMFASRNDLIEVSEHLKEENAIYMAIFALVHFQALMLTLVFIIDIFGKRIESRIEAGWLLLGAKDRKLFLFDGADERTAAVARDLADDPDNVIVFVKGVLDPEVKSLSIFEAFIKGTRNRAKADGFEGLGHVINAPMSLSVALSTGKGWVYKSMMKLIRSHRASEIFLISWDSPMNSEAAYSLSQRLPDGMDVRIFAGVNSEKAHSWKLEGQKYVHIFNRSESVVNDLCANTPLMSEDKSSRTLILGFGHTAMKCIAKLAEAGFEEIDVIDPETGCRREEFLCFNPRLRQAGGLRFYSYATRSNEFWSYMNDNMKGIHRVVIFGQDKAANYENAAQIVRYAQTVDKDMSGFHIYLMEDGRQPGDDAACISTFGKTDDIYRYQHITQA